MSDWVLAVIITGIGAAAGILAVVVGLASASYFMVQDIWKKLDCHKDYYDHNPMKEKLSGRE